MSYIKTGREIHEKPRWTEKHHMWWGILGLVIGFIFMYYAPKFLFLIDISNWGRIIPFGLWLLWMLFWLWNVFDDVIQHFIQLKQWHKFGYYDQYSFLHWFPYRALDWIKGKL